MLQGGILCFEVGSYVFILFVMFPSSHMFSFQRLTSVFLLGLRAIHRNRFLLNYHLTQALIMVMPLSLCATFYTYVIIRPKNLANYSTNMCPEFQWHFQKEWEDLFMKRTSTQETYLNPIKFE